MTLDQIWSRLCKIDILKRDVGERIERMEPGVVTGGTVRPDADGMIRGRAADGTPIRGQIRGVSKARMLMMKQAEEAVKKKRAERRRNRRGH